MQGRLSDLVALHLPVGECGMLQLNPDYSIMQCSCRHYRCLDICDWRPGKLRGSRAAESVVWMRGCAVRKSKGKTQVGIEETAQQQMGFS